ncbi:hypothetical protein OH77DRAFT_1586347 [Trametes cingulata]|nr:hypothetical protein OH77DRAFT_1586347 [Trametes cingulata]
MVEYHLGLTPGVIVALVIILVVLTAMLVSTVFVVWRSRPAALARAQQRQEEAAARRRSAAAPDDLESGAASSDKPSHPISILKKTTTITQVESACGEDENEKTGGCGRDEDQDDASVDGSPDPQTPRLGGATVSHSPSSTGIAAGAAAVNVIIATDGAGGVEVRVTPPTPSQSLAAIALKPKAERRVRFETLAGMQGEHESVWWFI